MLKAGGLAVPGAIVISTVVDNGAAVITSGGATTTDVSRHVQVFTGLHTLLQFSGGTRTPLDVLADGHLQQ